ncbi:MAG: Fic family protein [Campylobacterota bacterium]|nr:Fic family protein [Campylobacterota bacterium]
MAKIYDTMTKTDIKTFMDELKIHWTYTSNAIEGNTISLGDTAFIIEYGLTVKGKSIREHNEVLGHSRAIDLIYKFINKDKLEEADVFELHTAIQTNIVIDSECPIGDYKIVENGRYILGKDGKRTYKSYPNPYDIKHLILLWFNEFSDISKQDISLEESIRKYTRCHVGFTSIHPFFDGNGRLARLVSNIYMLKNGYLPIIINNENRAEYIEFLSDYNINSQLLDKKSIKIIEENEYFEKLYEFFKLEYQNSQILLDEIKK